MIDSVNAVTTFASVLLGAVLALAAGGWRLDRALEAAQGSGELRRVSYGSN
jgi:hypothetical protein